MCLWCNYYRTKCNHPHKMYMMWQKDKQHMELGMHSSFLYLNQDIMFLGKMLSRFLVKMNSSVIHLHIFYIVQSRLLKNITGKSKGTLNKYFHFDRCHQGMLISIDQSIWYCLSSFVHFHLLKDNWDKYWLMNKFGKDFCMVYMPNYLDPNRK